MLGLTRSLSSRLLVPKSGRILCNVRHETVDIITIAPPVPVTNETVGPYPRTKEEREKAAKKYNLIPEDYEPYPEDLAWGDYPKLPAIGAYNKDKYDDFDDVFGMRDYGEPYHMDADLYQWHKIDPLESKKPLYVPIWKKFLIFAAAGLFVPVTITIFEYFRLDINHQFKMVEYENKPRYTFPHSPNDNVHDHRHHHH